MRCRVEVSRDDEQRLMINPDLVCALPGPLGRRYCAENFPRPLGAALGPARPCPGPPGPGGAPNGSDASPASISTLMRRCRLGGDADAPGPEAGAEFWFVRQPPDAEHNDASGRPAAEEEIFVRGGHCVRTQFSPVELSPNPANGDSAPVDPSSPAGLTLGRLSAHTTDVVSAAEGETVLAACWAAFVVPDRSFAEVGRMWAAVSVLDEPAGARKEGVCLLTSDGCLLFHTTQGEKYEARVPFQVWNMWPARNGLLLEREPTDEEKQHKSHLPCVFFLGHPLDEPSPVVLQIPVPLMSRMPQGGGPNEDGGKQFIITADGRIQYANEANQRIVFVSTETDFAPMVLTYDHDARHHCLWKLRAALEAEYAGLLMLPAAKPGGADNPLTPVAPAPLLSRASLANAVNSPLSPFARSLTRLTHSPRSPLLPQHLSKLSQSPGAPRLSSPRFARMKAAAAAAAAAAGSPVDAPGVGPPHLHHQCEPDDDEGTGAAGEPLLPQACLQLLWVEQGGPAGAKRSAASLRSPVRAMQQRRHVVAFISEDYVRTRHLCFMVHSAQRLCCVKLEPISGNDGQKQDVAFGPLQSLPAQQAVYLPGQRLIVLLDPRQTIHLYSGTYRMCKLALPLLGSYPDAGPSSESAPGSPKASDASPPPRLLLHDPAQHAFTVEQTGSGLSLRVYLPRPARTRLVRRCLSALRQVLPREVGLKLASRWYTLHHAPGLDPRRPAEPAKFARFLLLAAGYPEAGGALDRLTGAGAALPAGDTPAKRMRRHSGAAGDANFAELVARLDRAEASGGRDLLRALRLPPPARVAERSAEAEEAELSPGGALLGRHLPVVMLALHLVYEDEKLIEEEWRHLDCLAGLLFILARDLGLDRFADIYRSEYAELVSELASGSSPVRIADRQRLVWPGHFQSETGAEHPPHLLSWLVSLLSNRFLIPFPLLPGVNDLSRTIVTAFVVFHADAAQLQRRETLTDRYLHVLPTSTGAGAAGDPLFLPPECLVPGLAPLERLLAYLSYAGVDAGQLNRLPGGLSLAFREALRLCLLRPPKASPATFRLVGREDLARQAAGNRPTTIRPLRDPPAHYTRHIGAGLASGGAVSTARLLSCPQLTHPLLAALECDPVVQALFPGDLRVREAYRLLQSSTRVRLRPGAARPEAPEDYQNQLLAVSVRTLALPVGRGLLTLHLHAGELPNRQIIAPICLQGKVGPRNLNVDLKKTETPATYKYWPEFHNGVASALVYSPHAPIDASWILYTSRSLLKLGGADSAPGSDATGPSGVSPERAGFLLGLGLNGHLNRLPHYDIKRFKYHEMVTMALLLGLCAGRRASLDQKLTRILAIHYGPLLPPANSAGAGPASGSTSGPGPGAAGPGGAFAAPHASSAAAAAAAVAAQSGAGELEMHRYVQASAVMGLGLLYQGSAHRHMAEVLLREIGRGPGPDIAHREVMALTAGLALGLVMLGKGESAHGGFHDLNMAQQLHAYMVGGLVRSGAARAPGGGGDGNNQIREGQHYNVDVTSPGATLALGLMFINTGNRGIAEWLAVPETQFLLDNVRPDLLLLRTLACGLIMWDSIAPTDAWIDSHLPPVVRRFAFSKNRKRDGDGAQEEEEEEESALWAVDNETMTLAYLNTECGCALAMALRFAGTADPDAYRVLMARLRRLLETAAVESLGGGNPQSELLEANNRSAYEQALGLLLLAVSMVMAGTGDLDLLCLCRMLRARVGQGTMFGVSYGCHMMYAMASGLLFLGGGKMTLDNSPESAAVLVCALFPKFPCMGNDNKYHLQAFRHLAVLAARARCVCPIAVSNNRVFPSTMRLVLKSGLVMEKVKLPCNLPPLDQIERIEFHDPAASDAWPLQLAMNNAHHRALLDNALSSMGGILFVQERDASSADEAAKLVLESYLARMCDPLHMWQLKFLSVFTKACPRLDIPSLMTSDHWQSTVIAINHRFVVMGESEARARPDDLASGLVRYYNEDSSALTDGRVASFIIWHGLPPRGLLATRLGDDVDFRDVSFGQFCKQSCELADTSLASLWQLFRLLRVTCAGAGRAAAV